MGGCEPLAVSKRRCPPHPGRPPFASSEGVLRRRGSKATAQFLLCIGPAFSQNGHLPAASLQTFLQDRSLPLPPASNCWAKTAFPTSASLDHPKLSGLALHSIIQVAIPTVLMDLGGRLRATCCKQATMPSTSRAATIRFKRRGPPQARLEKRQHNFCCASDRHLTKMATPCSKSPNFSPR